MMEVLIVLGKFIFCVIMIMHVYDSPYVRCRVVFTIDLYNWDIAVWLRREHLENHSSLAQA
jgi:hypothetical protein